jgi:hypothetical protein
LLATLPSTPVATPRELLELIARRSLQGKGCGLVDVSLLAGAMLAENTRLWTHDRRLHAMAEACAVAYPQPLGFGQAQ